MKTKARANRSATSHQRELMAKQKLSDLQFQEMLEMLEGLTAAERRKLKDADFITEDEADIIVSNRRAKEPGPRTSLDQLLAEEGVTPRHKRSA